MYCSKAGLECTSTDKVLGDKRRRGVPEGEDGIEKQDAIPLIDGLRAIPLYLFSHDDRQYPVVERSMVDSSLDISSRRNLQIFQPPAPPSVFDSKCGPEPFFTIPFPLINAMQPISDGMRQLRLTLNAVNELLLGVGPSLDLFAKGIDSLFSLVEWNQEHMDFISDFVVSFRRLNGIWAGLGKVWTDFSSKMNSLSSRVDILSTKFSASIKVS